MLAVLIPEDGQPLDNALLKELVLVLRRAGGDRPRPLLERILSLGDPAVRREAAAALGHYKSDELDSLWLRHLDDEDAEVRSLALTALVRTGRSDLARRILAESLDSPVFEGLPLLEKRRRFVAVSKLGGEQALNWFADLLRPNKRWFASRRTQEIEQAAAHGLRTIGSEAARSLLRQLAASGDRWVRAACQAELEG
jgi:HEAT repeat protein